MNDLDWGSRYVNFRAIARKSHQSIGGRCCLCFVAESKEVHHVCYRDGMGAIAGREIPGKHVFPLCKSCHDLAHSKQNWIKDRFDPVLGNRNTPAFIRRLILGYKMHYVNKKRIGIE